VVAGGAGLLAAPWLRLARAEERAVDTLDDDWPDATRGRAVAVRIRIPRGQPARGLVLFSHGLGGTRGAGAVWAQAWAAAGFAVVCPQHAGSDNVAVRAAGLGGVGQVASIDAARSRLQDVAFVVAESRRRGLVKGAAAQAVGMSGHSFGGHTTLSLAGRDEGMGRVPNLARMAGGGAALGIQAYACFSPGSSTAPQAAQYRQVTAPTLCLTGSEDDDPLARLGLARGHTNTPAERRAVFAALPAGSKALLWLDGADHFTFGGSASADTQTLRFLRRPALAQERQAAHHAVVARISTDWWRWRLLGDESAAQRLAQPQVSAPDEWLRG
jgi:predicted dienelactone hydrolase